MTSAFYGFWVFRLFGNDQLNLKLSWLLNRSQPNKHKVSGLINFIAQNEVKVAAKTIKTQTWSFDSVCRTFVEIYSLCFLNVTWNVHINKKLTRIAFKLGYKTFEVLLVHPEQRAWKSKWNFYFRWMHLPGDVISDKRWMYVHSKFFLTWLPMQLKLTTYLWYLSNFLHIEIISATWKAFEFNLILILQ